jgi:hypothetical protein
MKKWLRNIGTMSIALLVLFSSLSFGVSKHYCAGEVSNVSYFLSVDGCVMEKNISSCDTSESEGFNKKSCCETKYQFIDGNDFLQKDIVSFITLEFDNVLFLYQEISSIDIELVSENKNIYYSPPILLTDRTVLFETYLI